MKFSLKCRTKELGMPFWEVFAHFLIGKGLIFGPKSGLVENPCMYEAVYCARKNFSTKFKVI